MVSTPLKNINQLGLAFSIYGKIKNVANHHQEQHSVADFRGNKYMAFPVSTVIVKMVSLLTQRFHLIWGAVKLGYLGTFQKSVEQC